MDGAALAAKRERDLAFWQAWHAALLDGLKRSDLKRVWTAYFRDERSAVNDPQGLLAHMRALQQKGLPVNIKRLN